MANGADLGQAYLDWLRQQIVNAGYGDPENIQTWWASEETGRAWWSNDPDIAWQEAYQNAKSLIEQGAWGTSAMLQLPNIDEFLSLYGGVQEALAPTGGVPSNATRMGNLDLYQLPDGSFVDSSGMRVDPDYAATMLQDWLASKRTSGLTASEQAQLQLALDNLAWEKYQYGTLSADQQAQLAQAQTELAAQQNYYNQQYNLQQQQGVMDYYDLLAQLSASPANWIQRWYAERLPQGAEIPEELKTDWAAIGEALMQPYQPTNVNIAYPTTYSAGVPQTLSLSELAQLIQSTPSTEPVTSLQPVSTSTPTIPTTTIPLPTSGTEMVSGYYVGGYPSSEWIASLTGAGGGIPTSTTVRPSSGAWVEPTPNVTTVGGYPAAELPTGELISNVASNYNAWLGGNYAATTKSIVDEANKVVAGGGTAGDIIRASRDLLGASYSEENNPGITQAQTWDEAAETLFQSGGAGQWGNKASAKQNLISTLKYFGVSI
jgi:hypothetical protein